MLKKMILSAMCVAMSGVVTADGFTKTGNDRVTTADVNREFGKDYLDLLSKGIRVMERSSCMVPLMRNFVEGEKDVLAQLEELKKQGNDSDLLENCIDIRSKLVAEMEAFTSLKKMQEVSTLQPEQLEKKIEEFQKLSAEFYSCVETKKVKWNDAGHPELSKTLEVVEAMAAALAMAGGEKSWKELSKAVKEAKKQDDFYTLLAELVNIVGKGNDPRDGSEAVLKLAQLFDPSIKRREEVEAGKA